MTSFRHLAVAPLAVLAACSGSSPGPSSGTKSKDNPATTTQQTGVTWEVLSLEQNVSARRKTATPQQSPIPALRANSIRQSLALGQNHSCALAQVGRNAGKVLCWGDNTFGQLGNGSSSAGPFEGPVEVKGISNSDGEFVLQIAAGGFHTCALTSPGNIYCWGKNASGQLGVDPARARSSTEAVLVAAGGIAFSQVTAGADQTCALGSADSIPYCWGSNSSGQLGNGTTTDSFVPQAILIPDKSGVALPFAHIATSANHTCAAEGPEGAFTWGSVYCWGDDSSSQLANTGTATPMAGKPHLYPSPVLSLDNEGYPDTFSLDGAQVVERLALGASFSCGMTIYGNYYCWGDNSQGQLSAMASTVIFPSDNAGHYYGPYVSTAFGNPAGGLGFTSQFGGPVPYTSALADIAPQMAAGNNHVCQVAAGNAYGYQAASVYCWGSNSKGQLGPGSPAGRYLLTLGVDSPAAGETFNEIAAGGDHTCAASSGGSLYCWGDNAFGQLGAGRSPDSAAPRLVAGGPFFLDVSQTPALPANTAAPLVDCQPDEAGTSPNGESMSSYLFYARDVFAKSTHVTEVDFDMGSDDSTGANAFELALYAYSDDGGYNLLGKTTASNLFPGSAQALAQGPVVHTRFIFAGDGISVPATTAAQPVVMQLRQISGSTLALESHGILNTGTAACPIDPANRYTSIPLQIFTR